MGFKFYKMIRITTALFLFIPHIVFSQVDIKNISLTTPDSAIIYADTLFGIENKIEMTGLNDKAYLRLKSGKGEITRDKLNPSVFIFNAELSGKDSAVIEVYVSYDLVFTKSFQIRALADPIPMLGNFADSAATVDEIILNPVINVVLPGSYYKHSYRVIYFKAIILSSKGRVQVFDREGGNRLTKDQLKKVEVLKKGNKIELTEITVTCNDCAIRRLGDLTVRIE